MHILILSSIDRIEVNGIKVSVPALTQALSEVTQVTHIDEHDSHYSWFFKSFDFSKFNPPIDVICFQEVYKPWFWKCAKKARQHHIPYTITPRVSLTQGAQAQKAWKKKLANIFFVKKFVNEALALHFLNEHESHTSLHFKQPHTIIIGNGVNVPEVMNTQARERVMVLLVRKDIDHKGLDICVEAVKELADEFRKQQFQIHIHGSDYKNQEATLLKLIQEAEVEDIIYSYPAIFNQDKIDKLSSSQVILLPSRFEGHPQGLLEGLAYGCVGIASSGSNMADEIVQNQAGFHAHEGKEGLIAAFKAFFHYPEFWPIMSANAHAWMKESAKWSMIAASLLSQLSDLLGHRRVS
jgi:glycosyltransferase involved in cell wall biosynthesis